MPTRIHWTAGATRATLAGGVAVVAVLLALTVDHPVERWVTSHRTDGTVELFRAATHLGDPGTAFALGVVFALAAAWRSRRVALAIAVVTVLRPLVSTVVKNAVGRERPQLGQLVQAAGASFPSGHALAAAVAWGCLPAVLLVWQVGRDVVRAAFVAVTLVVLAVATSRVYLGVHWVSDVVGGVALGVGLLVVVYRMVPRP